MLGFLTPAEVSRSFMDAVSRLRGSGQGRDLGEAAEEGLDLAELLGFLVPEGVLEHLQGRAHEGELRRAQLDREADGRLVHRRSLHLWLTDSFEGGSDRSPTAEAEGREAVAALAPC